MKKDKLKIGIIGCGGIAHGPHAKGWEELGETAEVVAVCDVREEAAQSLANKTGAKKALTDFNELVSLDEIDAVDICTPNKFHTPAAIAALNAGKHVLCEKPLAVSTDEVKQLGELADKKGLLLMTAQHMRYMPMSLSLKRFVDDGAIGNPYHSRVHAIRRNLLPISPGFIDSSLSGGGPCMDIGVHCLDACMWLMGFPKPVKVTGVARTNFAKGHDI
ncbi:MAG: Gfo/Idh/MocA family oxidoreductase, partial [Planctomycetes bacterium]|nr:Gfo/Idh/MocA family oxidoreductase [Planctomycetota bacterium]